MSLKVIASFTKVYEAYLARNQLTLEGIHSFVFDEYAIGVHPFYSNALGGVKVVVDDTDFEKAKDIITAYINSQKIYFMDIKTHCPNCHSKNIRKTSNFHIILSMAFIITFGILWVVFYRKYKCFDCGHSQAW